MSVSPETSQALFAHEYEQELETWLRRRFAWLCGTYVVLGAVKLIWWVLKLLGAAGQPASPPLAGGLVVLGLAGVSLAIVAAFYAQRDRFETRDDVLRAASWMILALGSTSLASRFAEAHFGVTQEVGVIVAVFFWHFTACLFLPWTPRDSLRPILPLLAVWALHTLALETGTDLFTRLLKVMFSPGILIPGLVISGWRLKRHGRRFRSAMLGRQFRSMRQELSRARAIHEGLFPPEYDDGHVRLQYTYRPMRELGGDFLHVHVGAEGLVHLALIDVTGHGLAAALTVNRIFGEMQRIRAEAPSAPPGVVLHLLNRYMHLTMSTHNIYATAIAMRLDPWLGEIGWASAGHPPAFLRGVNGVVRDLASNALMLGAVGDDDFEIGDQTFELAPGDVILAYTDGAIEARDRRGEQLGVERLRDLLHRRPVPDDWAEFVSASVAHHQVGRAEDDVLVAALSFSAARTRTAPARRALAGSP